MLHLSASARLAISGAPRWSACLRPRSQPRPSFSHAGADHDNMSRSCIGCGIEEILSAGARNCRALRWRRSEHEGEFALPAARTCPALFSCLTNAFPPLSDPRQRRQSMLASHVLADNVRTCSATTHQYSSESRWQMPVLACLQLMAASGIGSMRQ